MPAELLVRCVHGTEWVAATEVQAKLPGARDITMTRRQLTFTLPELDPRVLDLGCADDAFLHVGHVDRIGLTTADLPVLARGMARLDWTHAVDAVTATRADHTVGNATGDTTPQPRAPGRFDCVASIEGKHSYNRFAAENTVGEALADLLGLRFLPRSPTDPAAVRTRVREPRPEPDVTVRLFLRGTSATAALRVARRPLHRRPYKLATGPGTLHPPLAAALATIAGADGITVHDPFCGDGTLAIETARTWPTARVSAGDLDPARTENTRANAARAGVDIAVSTADAADLLRARSPVGLLLTNPPWNVATTPDGKLRSSLDAFWSDATTVLGDSGRVCTVTDAALNIPDILRRHRFTVGLAMRLRLAGRIVHVTVAAAPHADTPRLSSCLARWRRRALRDNVITEHGF